MSKYYVVVLIVFLKNIFTQEIDSSKMSVYFSYLILELEQKEACSLQETCKSFWETNTFCI